LHSQYFQLAGVTSAVQREWLSSIFSASQIVGGLVMGALSDSNWISKHSILTISFLGSAFAYAMIVQGGLAAVIVSRVTVGLVKQTMTVTSSMMAHATDEADRATHVGR
jgi:MFS family permease